MPLSTIGWKLSSLLRLLIAALSLETVSQHGTSKGASQRRERVRFLSPDNLNDVKEFRTRLQRAELDLAKFLLGIVEALLEFKRGSEDPQKVEENRMHLETIEKGEYREGRGWYGTAIWFRSHNRDATFLKEERGSFEMGCGILLVGGGSIKANSLGFGIIDANRTVLICGA